MSGFEICAKYTQWPPKIYEIQKGVRKSDEGRSDEKSEQERIARADSRTNDESRTAEASS